MDRFYQDIRFAMRTLATRRAFSVVAIVTLALGIGITTAIFSVVNGILLRPLPFKDSGRIVTVWETSKKDPQKHGQLAHPTYLDLENQAKSFESIAEYSPGTATLTGNGPATIISEAIVTPDFFHVFGATPVLGREFTAEEDRPKGPNVVVIGYSFWKEKLGGSADVIGSSINVSGSNHTIVGVAPEGFDYPNKSQMWTPPQNNDVGCGRGCSYMQTVARLAPGASVEHRCNDIHDQPAGSALQGSGRARPGVHCDHDATDSARARGMRSAGVSCQPHRARSCAQV